MVYALRFCSSKYSLFHNSKVFGFCIIHMLYTGCVKIKKNNSGAKRLNQARSLIGNPEGKLKSSVRTPGVPKDSIANHLPSESSVAA